MNKEFTYLKFFKIPYFLLSLTFCWIPGVKANSDGSGLLRSINHHTSARSHKPVSSSSYRAAKFDLAAPNPTISGVTTSSFVVNWTNSNANADNNQYQMVFVAPETSNPIVLSSNHIYYNYIANNEITDQNKAHYTLDAHYLYRNQNNLPYDNYAYIYEHFMYASFSSTKTTSLNYPQFIHDNNNYSGGIPSSENYGGPVDESLKWVCVHNSTLNDISSVTVSNLPANTKYRVLVVNWSFDKVNNKFIYNTTIDATTSVLAVTTPPVISLNNLSSATASVDLAAHLYGDSSYVGIPITGTNLNSGITVTAPSGFLVKYQLATGGLSAYVQSYTIPATNNTNSNSNSVNSIVYIRSPGTLPAGSNHGQVTIHTQDADASIVINSATVNPRPLNVYALPVSKVYGETLSAALYSSTNFKTDVLTNNETIGSVSLANNNGSMATDKAGNYAGAVSVSAATGGSFTASNYALTYVPADIQVTTAPLTVATSPVSKVYGQTLTASSGSVAFTTTGVKNGETIGSVSLAYGTGALGTYAVNTYPGSVTPSAATGGSFSARNYTITYPQADLTVTAAPLTIAASPVNKVYGQALTATSGSGAFTPTGLQNGETIGSISLAYGTGALGTDAVNTYLGSVTPSAAAGGTFTAANYSLTYPQADLTVTPAPLAVTANPISKVYGQALTGAPNSTLFTSAGLQNNEKIASVSLAYGAGALTTDAVNTYSGSVTPSAASGGGFAASNYTITYPQADITVTPAPLTIATSSVNKVYGQTLTAASGSVAFSSTGLQNNETIGSVSLGYGKGAKATDAVNTYSGAITPSGALGGTFKSPDYTITYTPADLTVTPALLTAVINKMHKVYGQPNPAPTLTVTGLVNGDSQKSTVVQFTTDMNADYSTPVGSYPVTITSTTVQNSNYYFPTGGSGSLTITPATVVITPSIVYKPYGQAIVHESQNFTSFTSDGLQNNETIGSVSLSYGEGARAIDPVYAYDNSVSPFSAVGGTFTATNYSLIYFKTALIVTAAPLSIATSPVSKVYGQTLTAGAGSAAFTPTGLQNNETIGSVSLGYGTGANATDAVNTYQGSVTPSAAAGGNFSARNYTITYPQAQLTVSPAPLAIATSYVSKVYGQVLTTVSGSGAFTSTGLQNGETIGSISLAFGTGALGTDAVSIYSGSITPSAGTGGTFTATNYSITYPQADLTVTVAPLTITANTVVKTYGNLLTGGANSTLFTSTGLQNNETLGTGTLAYGPGALRTDSVGDYMGAVSVSALSGGSYTPTNYSTSYVPGNTQVTPANLNVSIDTVRKTYGKTLANGKLSNVIAVGLQNNDKIDSVKVSYNNGKSGTVPAGKYANGVQYSNPEGMHFNASNYNITYGDGENENFGYTYMKVTPAPLFIEADDQFKIYGQPNPVLRISYTGFVNGEDSTVLANRSVASTKATASSAAGTYAITLPVGATNSNYTISTFGGNLTIGQAPLLLTADSKAKVYGQADPAFTITSAGFVNGDNLSGLQAVATYTSATSMGNSTAAGTYPLSVTNAVSQNYVISYVPGVFTVSQAPLTLTAMDTTKNYGQRIDSRTSSTAFTATGLQNKETIGSVNMVYGQGRAAADVAGTYSNSAQLSAATGGSAVLKNYTLTYLNGSIYVLALRPVVMVLPVTMLESSSVMLNTNATDGGALTTVTLVYSTDAMLKGAIKASFSTGVSPLSAGAGKTKFCSMLMGLMPGTTYYYQLTATNSAGMVLSGIYSFTTLSTDAHLASAGLSNGSLNPAFSPTTFTYSLTAVSSESSVTLNLMTAESHATVQVNGMPVSGSATIALRTGNNTIQVLVTAQDGVTQLSYLVNIYRVIALESLAAGNILSPNHDGKNDLWIVKDIQYYPNNTVTVYDRLGRIVYSKNGYANDWGGTSRGVLLNEDTYYYLVDFGPGERKMKGFITIVRDI